MATLAPGKSPGKRIVVGDQVLCAVDAVDTSTIAVRVASFKKAHLLYSAAEMAVRKMAQALRTRQEVVFDADVALNVAVDLLANALPADGFPRQNPFRVFGAPTPSALKAMGMAGGANEVLALEKAVLMKSSISPRSADAARAAGDAARKVQAALKPLAKLQKARIDAMARRDALAPGWSKALASLKLAAMAADDEGHAGLFAALFDRPAPAKKRAASKRNSAQLNDAAPLSAPPSR